MIKCIHVNGGLPDGDKSFFINRLVSIRQPSMFIDPTIRLSFPSVIHEITLGLQNCKWDTGKETVWLLHQCIRSRDKQTADAGVDLHPKSSPAGSVWLFVNVMFFHCDVEVDGDQCDQSNCIQLPFTNWHNWPSSKRIVKIFTSSISSSSSESFQWYQWYIWSMESCHTETVSLVAKELSESGSSPRTLRTSTYIAYPTKPQKRLSYHVLSVLEKNAVEILLSWLSWLYPIYHDIYYMNILNMYIYIYISDISDISASIFPSWLHIDTMHEDHEGNRCIFICGKLLWSSIRTWPDLKCKWNKWNPQIQ